MELLFQICKKMANIFAEYVAVPISLWFETLVNNPLGGIFSSV
jgi:hypothetical protein